MRIEFSERVPGWVFGQSLKTLTGFCFDIRTTDEDFDAELLDVDDYNVTVRLWNDDTAEWDGETREIPFADVDTMRYI